jgi:hypothetical protein
VSPFFELVDHVVEDMDGPQPPPDPPELDRLAVLDPLNVSDGVGSVADKVLVGLDVGGAGVEKAEADGVEVVSHVEPEEHCGSAAGQLLLGCGEHAVDVEPRHDVLLVNVLLQLPPVLLEHAELGQLHIALLGEVLMQLEVGAHRHDLIILVEVGEVDEGVLGDGAFLLEFVFPVEHLMGLVSMSLKTS